MRYRRYTPIRAAAAHRVGSGGESRHGRQRSGRAVSTRGKSEGGTAEAKAKVCGEGHPLCPASTPSAFLSPSSRARQGHLPLRLADADLRGVSFGFLVSQLAPQDNCAHFTLRRRECCTKTLGWKNISHTRAKTERHPCRGGNRQPSEVP